MVLQHLHLNTPGKSTPCIWTQAGVGGRKSCALDYECTTCRYDQVLRRAAENNRRLQSQGKKPTGRRGRIVSWKDKLRELPPAQQPCRHHLKGRIGFRACINNYSCSDCEFDQYFEDHFAVHATINPIKLLDVDGFKIPQGYYLHPGHTWIKIEASHTVRIGIDEFAYRLLGPFDGITAPLVGKPLSRGRPAIKLRRNGHTADLLSPVNGVILAANQRLRESGRIAGKDIYTQGWIARTHAGQLRRDIPHLMIGDEASAFIAREVKALYAFIEDTAGPLAADGGQLGADIFGKMPQLGWQRLTRRFLR